MYWVTFLLLGTLSFPGKANWELVNAVAANIAGKPFTVQDTYVYRALERSLSEKKPLVLIEKGEVLKKTVRKAVLQRLLVKEAKEASFKPPNSKKPVKKSDLKEIMRVLGGSETALREKMAEIQMSDEFFKMKVLSLTPIITDTDVQEYSQTHSIRLKKAGLSDQTEIRKLLQRERREKAVQEYINFLTTKYEVVLFDL